MNKYPLNIKNKEKWTPKETHHAVSTYIDLTEHDISSLIKQPTKNLKSNLTYKEHSAMEELAKRKDLVLTNADNVGLWLLWTQTATLKKSIQYYLTKQATNN